MDFTCPPGRLHKIFIVSAPEATHVTVTDTTHNSDEDASLFEHSNKIMV